MAELDAANLPTDIAAIPTTAMRGTDNAALASVATEGRLAELDAANLPTDIAAIPTTAMRGTDNANTVVPATKAEMDTAHALLATQANVATELGTYDGPTKAEMDTAHALLATVAKQDVIDGIVDSVLEDTVLVDKWLKNKMAFSGTSMILYDDDGSTPLLTWTLSEGSTSVSGPYNRAKAT